jgi:hypothetical protein
VKELLVLTSASDEKGDQEESETKKFWKPKETLVQVLVL